MLPIGTRNLIVSTEDALGNQDSMRHIGEIIGNVVGKAAQFTIDIEGEGDIIGDIHRLEELLGYRPCVSFHTGISLVCQAAGVR